MSAMRILKLAALVAFLMVLARPAAAQSEPPSEPQPTAREAAPTEPEAPAGPDLTEANELILEGDYEAAEAALAALAVEFPDDPVLLLAHGEVLLALRRPEEALARLERSAALDPTKPRVHFQLAAALTNLGQEDRAFEEFGKELETNEEPQVLKLALLNRSMLLGKKKDWAGSAAELERALEVDPSQVPIYGDLATLYIQAGDLERARDALARGEAAGFVSAAHYYSLGARFYSDERDEEAVAAFRKAIELDPEMARAERSLAAALERAGRPQEAVAHLKRYLELTPDAPDVDQVSEKIRLAEKG